MSDSDPLKRSASATAIRRFAALLCCLAMLLAVVAVMSQPLQLSPGQVIDQYGTYRLGTSQDRLKIQKDAAGNVVMTVLHRTTRYWLVPRTTPSLLATFESERGWFCSLDEHGRLWVYHGHWDRAWGELRQMPSGGFVPYAPAVLLRGEFAISNSEFVHGDNIVTATGDWAGVPKPFFERIPDRQSAQWGNVPTLPASPPEFTKRQLAQLARIAKLRR